MNDVNDMNDMNDKNEMNDRNYEDDKKLPYHAYAILNCFWPRLIKKLAIY